MLQTKNLCLKIKSASVRSKYSFHLNLTMEDCQLGLYFNLDSLSTNCLHRQWVTTILTSWRQHSHECPLISKDHRLSKRSNACWLGSWPKQLMSWPLHVPGMMPFWPGSATNGAGHKLDCALHFFKRKFVFVHCSIFPSLTWYVYRPLDRQRTYLLTTNQIKDNYIM